jgi:hypothetical protein
MLVWLFAAHALCDYPLQGDWLSKAKNPNLELVPGERIWPLALTSHALIQAAAVQLITGSWLLATIEFAAHWAIDYAKCMKHFGYNADQVLHLATKIVLVAILLIAGKTP